jgi:hypothetical protein
MNDIRRVITWTLVAVLALGALPQSGFAQAPAPPPPPAPAAVEVAPPDRPVTRGPDVYDVGAGVVTAARMPFNVALCALGGVVGTVIFALTLGSAYKASTRAVEEGCAHRWILSGDDLRPHGSPGMFPDRPTDSPYARR